MGQFVTLWETDRIGAISVYARKSAEESSRTRLVNIIPSVSPLLSFFLRPEGHWSGLSGKGSHRVRLHHQKPCNRRVTHAVGGCKSRKACHAFHRAVAHRVPNNPLFVSQNERGAAIGCPECGGKPTTGGSGQEGSEWVSFRIARLTAHNLQLEDQGQKDHLMRRTA